MGRFISEDPYTGEITNPLSLNLYTYCENNPINYVDPTGFKKAGDGKYSQDVQDSIKIYSDFWWDAENAYKGGLISKSEKEAIQTAMEYEADQIRFAAGHPVKTVANKTVEFLIFDVFLGGVSGKAGQGGDYSDVAFDKMLVALAVNNGFTGGNSRTLGYKEIRGNKVRVDMEMPTGGSTGNVHIQIKGKGGPQKIYVNSIDDLANLSKKIGNDPDIIRWVTKAFKLLGKMR